MFESQFIQLIDGHLNDADAGSFLLSTAKESLTGDRLAFAARALRERMTLINYPQPLLDTCGTGGDQQSTINISTAAAIVLAGGGVKVAKHGNRAVSSSSGSSEVLSALGIIADLPVEGVVACLEKANLGFIFAPRFHPRLKALAPLRKQLGVPTIFNFLGPLCNPARVCWQILGVGKRETLRPMAEALVQLNVKRAVVVHGEPGLDEVSLHGETHACLIHGSDITEQTWTPADFGYETLSINTIRCKDATESAQSIASMLKNEDQPCRPWVLANVAVGLLIADQVKTLRDGVQRAEEVVRSGLALLKLEQLRMMSAACCRPAAL
jgi:anthranilate phosphoribosyltransferase